ncbi:MAG TPA: ERCC4 domain-containing protein [Candidatus Bathyarchaeia archaeon]|nr:ERCC4 domain-containing protein [Candidatus Bathyarchaeia archaeon]
MRLPRIVIDSRESASGIPELLEERGIYVQRRLLDVADYVVGQYAIERKTVHDFISSLYSGRLFDQAQRITQAYSKFLLIVEGDIQEAFVELKNPRAYWGALLTLALGFDFKIFYTFSIDETVDLLSLLARRGGTSGLSGRPLIVKKPPITSTKEWQLLVLGSLPTIGPVLAEKLLRSFGSLHNIFTASRIELAVSGGIGESRAQKVFDLIRAEYKRKVPKQTKLA